MQSSVQHFFLNEVDIFQTHKRKLLCTMCMYRLKKKSIKEAGQIYDRRNVCVDLSSLHPSVKGVPSYKDSGRSCQYVSVLVLYKWLLALNKILVC
jgi:hypothetical protein